MMRPGWVLLVLSVVVDVVLGASLSRYQGLRSSYTGELRRISHFNHPLRARSRLHPRSGHIAYPAVQRGVFIQPTTTRQVRLPLAYDNGGHHAQPTPEFAFGGRWGQLRATAQLTDAPTASCHAGTLVHLSEGRVLAAWFGGTFEGLEDTAIYTALRFSHGNWSEPLMAAKVHRGVPYGAKPVRVDSTGRPQRSWRPQLSWRGGGEPHWNPVLFYDQARSRVLLFFKVGWQIKDWETFVTESTDAGATWSDPVELVPGDRGGRGPVKNKLIVLADGTWLAPASLEKNSWRAFVDRSTDRGVSWQRSPDVLASTGVGVIQPSLWESPPGHVHMLLRSARDRSHQDIHIMRASSHDGGLTWSRAHPTSLPNNNAGLDVARMPSSGLLVLAYNPVQPAGGRTPLRLSISSDDGRTWPLSWDVETEKTPGPPAHYGEAGYLEFSYPGVVAWEVQREGDEEGFTLIYTWHRTRMAVLSISITQLQALCKTHPPAV